MFPFSSKRVDDILEGLRRPMWETVAKPTTFFIGTCPRCKSTWVTNGDPRGKNPCKCDKRYDFGEQPEPLTSDDLLWCAAD